MLKINKFKKNKKKKERNIKLKNYPKHPYCLELRLGQEVQICVFFTFMFGQCKHVSSNCNNFVSVINCPSCLSIRRADGYLANTLDASMTMTWSLWDLSFFFPEFGVHLAELTVDREGALAIRQVWYCLFYICIRAYRFGKHPSVAGKVFKTRTNVVRGIAYRT